jgi:hypothetical protein
MNTQRIAFTYQFFRRVRLPNFSGQTDVKRIAR